MLSDKGIKPAIVNNTIKLFKKRWSMQIVFLSYCLIATDTCLMKSALTKGGCIHGTKEHDMAGAA
jgi:hypothetical protein